MATIIPSAPRRSLSESHQRVSQPAGRLRGYIRTYVSLEGALLLVLYVALWFWIGLALRLRLLQVVRHRLWCKNGRGPRDSSALGGYGRLVDGGGA